MNRKRALLLLAVSIALCGGAAAYYFKSKTSAPALAKETPATELLAADVAILKPVQVSQALVASGSIKPLRQAMVKSQVSAIVFTVNVQEGQAVKAGDLLATTDVQDYQSRVTAQQAQVAQANAQVAIAQRTVDNNKSLVDKGFISPSAYDAAVQQLDANKANVVAAQANLALSKKALLDTQIRAPIAGVITEKSISEGDKAAPEMKLFTITAPGAVEFEGTLPVAEAAQIKRGQTVLISLEGGDSGKPLALKSTISRINTAVTAGSRTVTFFAALPNQSSVPVGSFATAKVLVQSASMLAVPSAAVREEAGRSVVYSISSAPERLTSSVVKVGLRGETDAGEAFTAVEGLADGTAYVARNLGPLRVGSPVKVAK